MNKNINGNIHRCISELDDEKTIDAVPALTPTCSLADAPTGIPLQVSGINAGRGAQSRLASMGILPGEKVVVIQKENGGPILIEVKGTRVALGHGVSRKVKVQPGDGNHE